MQLWIIVGQNDEARHACRLSGQSEKILSRGALFAERVYSECAPCGKRTVLLFNLEPSARPATAGGPSQTTPGRDSQGLTAYLSRPRVDRAESELWPASPWAPG